MLVNEKVSIFANSTPCCVELMNGDKNKVKRTNKIGINFIYLYSYYYSSRDLSSSQVFKSSRELPPNTEEDGPYTRNQIDFIIEKYQS